MYEEINCVVCNNNNFQFVYKGYDKRYSIEGEFHTLICKNCGTYTLWPRLTQEEIFKYYPDEYECYPLAFEDSNSKFNKIDKQFHRKKFCQQVIKRSKIKKGRILDVGCATGIFLSGMKNFGWDCYGIEPSAYAANYARERFQLNVINGYIEDTNYPKNFFDVITLWDVLEHTINPKIILCEVRNLLKPDGILLFTIPNSQSWERHIFGSNWAGWDVPRHYNTFSVKTISVLLEKNELVADDIFGFTGRHGHFMTSLNFWINDLVINKKIKNLIIFILGSLLIRACFLPFFILAEKSLKSSTIAIQANKIQLS